MTDIKPQEKQQLASQEEANKRRAMQNFTKLMHRKPSSSEIQINSQAGNSKYLPISNVEMKLDEYFFGAWSTENFKWQQIGNEIVGSIDLKVLHPVLGQWLTRSGSGSVMIQFQRGADVTDFNLKIKNTLVKDFPHLKAECIKNAAKSFGKAFGRDINRKFEGDYTPLVTEKRVNE